MLQTLQWTGHALRLLDQTKLPARIEYVDITDEKQAWDAIKRLVVRGAPAIGVAAAFGAYLGIRNIDDREPDRFGARLKEVCDYLATSRPTAVNLFWALARVQRAAAAAREPKRTILNECLAMVEQDKRVCRAIGENGLTLLQELHSSRRSGNASDPIRILTHCNAGALATVAYGTALAPIYVGIERGLRFHVFADETRPLLQGSRITALELQHAGVPVTVLCDNMAASVMSGEAQGTEAGAPEGTKAGAPEGTKAGAPEGTKARRHEGTEGKSGRGTEARRHEGTEGETSRGAGIDFIIVGADRIAANGDVANKIGTLGVAILAKHFGVPFIVAAPTSTIDPACATGRDIPIEQRDAAEVTRPLGIQIAPDGVDVFNPAFDVTPAELVTAIVTEHGISRPPFEKSLNLR